MLINPRKRPSTHSDHFVEIRTLMFSTYGSQEQQAQAKTMPEVDLVHRILKAK